ncbi:unnamed protein product [Cercopithifilaria johnstoni]|uniref:Uncharacterized protein n=1 Tax=Cercopithifilaria johnstoni TaxID=2874296 RepID=A0A8J2QB91_9BILA|nr:unnamed protein product [Cercopithifilaria johnstoni]
MLLILNGCRKFTDLNDSEMDQLAYQYCIGDNDNAKVMLADLSCIVGPSFKMEPEHESVCAAAAEVEYGKVVFEHDATAA